MSSTARMRASVEFFRRESPNLEGRTTSVPVLGWLAPAVTRYRQIPGAMG